MKASRTGRTGALAAVTNRLVPALVACWLLSAAAAQASAAGAASADTAHAVFGDGVWAVLSVATPAGPVEFAPDGTAHFQLRPEGALAGTAGCNQMVANFSLADGQSISFGPVIATRMACPEPAMSRELAVLEAFEHVTEYRLDGERLLLAGNGYEIVLAPLDEVGGSTGAPDALGHGQDVARFAAAFNDAVAAAAAAGASWPSDPIRVALAYVDLLGAPNALITRADFGAGGEEASEDATETVITIVEDGLLDDSVAGMEQTVTLRRADGVWTVTSYTGMWLCRRPPGSSVALPGVCQ